MDRALRLGARGLAPGGSLARFLAQYRGTLNIQDLRDLNAEMILAWADAHYGRTKEWPTTKPGKIAGAGGETWSAVETALRLGIRGLLGGSSLAKLLAEHRDVRNRKGLLPLTEKQILAWADAHQQRNDSWPTSKAGPILDAPGETWMGADMALRHGRRGLPGGSSLARLLAREHAVRNVWTLRNLSIDQILSWADVFHERTRLWPHVESGAVDEVAQETWCAIDHALKRGSRGLPGGSSLAKLLQEHRDVRNRGNLPRLTRRLILAWADGYRRRTGDWPNRASGAIPESPGETWQSADIALINGARGLRSGSTLARLLAAGRGRPHHLDRPPLFRKRILAWADAHFQRTDEWPNVNSGVVVEAPRERWSAIDAALRQGSRGLDGGSSLLQLLVKKRAIRDPLRPPSLTEEQIRRWAELHHDQTGGLPRYKSGPVLDAPGETWAGLDSALRYGKRRLPGQSSLAKLLKG